MNSWLKTYHLKTIIYFIVLGISASGFSQKTLTKLLQKYNTESIPYITVEALKNSENDLILLDSREQKEYQTSQSLNSSPKTV